MDATTRTYAIETHGLTKAFHRKRAVDNVNLHVPAGSIYGLVGKNGAGKSTLLKLVSGLLARDEGSVSILGSPLASCQTDARLGILIEQPAVYERLDPFENLMNRALVLGLPNPRQACREVLALVGLSEREAGDGEFRLLWPRGSYTDDLSTGMRQRLGVALALIGNPEVLVLDEPFSGIDPAGAKSIRTTIRRLSREQGVTVIVSSHTIAHLERMCTHFGVMRAGKLVREVTSAELLEARTARLVVRVTNSERAVALLAEGMPDLALSVLKDGRLTIHMTPELEKDEGRAALSELLMRGGVAVTEMRPVATDLEGELVRLMEGVHAAGSSRPEGR